MIKNILIEHGSVIIFFYSFFLGMFIPFHIILLFIPLMFIIEFRLKNKYR